MIKNLEKIMKKNKPAFFRIFSKSTPKNIMNVTWNWMKSYCGKLFSERFDDQSNQNTSENKKTFHENTQKYSINKLWMNDLRNIQLSN